MGYRSDVRITVSNNGYKRLNNYVNDYLNKNPQSEDNFNLLTDPDIFKQSKQSTYLGWNYVKWYEDSFKDVDSIMYGLNKLKEDNLSFRFSRIGEDYTDYEEEIFDSDNKDEPYLEYPSVVREFDDDYVYEQLDKEDIDTSNEVEI